MKKLLIILAIFTIVSCDEVKKEEIKNFTIHIEVKYEDNSIDTLQKLYTSTGDIMTGVPKAFLNDKGCLEIGYSGMMFKSMSNIACKVKTFKPIYAITNRNDTIR